MPGATFKDQKPGSSSRAPSEAHSRELGKGEGGAKAKQKTFMDRWVEPALPAPTPSYQDHGAGPYGVLEHMQPLGEAPGTKSKQRVKADGSRKSMLGRSAAGVGGEAQDTPGGSPAPSAAMSHQAVEAPAAEPIVIDDERDADYAPRVNGKKKDRATRTRVVKRKSEPTTSAIPSIPPIRRQSPVSAPTQKFEYDGEKLKRVVEAAKKRAIEVGKPDLAAAVNEIYEQSLVNKGLRILLEAILTLNATPAQNNEFQDYVRAAKKKLKDAKNKARQQPVSKTDGREEKSSEAPLQPPQTKLTSRPMPPPPPETSLAIPSTKRSAPHKQNLSIKLSKSPSKNPSRHRSGHANMSVSPRKRAGSVGSDSSLTSMTSNEDPGDMDLDGPGDQAAFSSLKANGIKGKDHAAERGSLAAPGGSVKRSSAEADLDQDQTQRDIAAKKQRMSESQARDYDYQESSVREKMRAPKTRALQRLVPPPVTFEHNGSRTASTRGSRAASMDLDSPLSDLSPANSRQSTPRLHKAPPKPTGKRAKTKQSPEKKQLAAFSGMSGVGGAGRDSPIGDDDNEVASENNDFCSACGGSGYLLCCDGCDRSFHFTCLDHPLEEGAKELDEPWFCFICVAKRPAILDSPEKPARGLFAPLFGGLKKRNPSNFSLPEEIRNYYEGVSADKNGAFVEAMSGKPTRNRPGYSDDQPDYYKMRDSKGNLVLCYQCGKSSQQMTAPKRPIVTCDHCAQHWHLDCLDPPLSNPPALNQNGKKVADWMCPLHVDRDLRNIDTALLHRRRIHVRKPKNPRFMETSLRRGHINNGIIDIYEDESDASDSEFFDQDEGGVVYKLPEKGVKLDFIDKVKDTRIQRLRDERAYRRFEAAATTTYPSALEQANFAKRPFNEQQLALNLAQFARENKDLDLGSDQVENLVGTLIAEAPSAVVEEMMAAEVAEKTRSASSVIPPSPPASEQTLELSVEQRKELQMLQELIRRKLESSKT